MTREERLEIVKDCRASVCAMLRDEHDWTMHMILDLRKRIDALEQRMESER